MVSSHDLEFTDQAVTKRYRSWSRGEPTREWLMLRHLDRHTPGLAPRPIRSDLNGDPPWITMSRLPGQTLAAMSASVSAQQIRALVEAITTLWSVPLDLPGDLGIPDDLAFARRLTVIPLPAEPEAASAVKAAEAWWDGPDPKLLQADPPTRVLGHRDPNLANYLWDGTHVHIVDFEDAALSDPATEVALLVEHLSTRGMDSDHLSAQFAEDPARLLAARRAWAMYWLWMLLPGGPSHTRNPADVAKGQALRLIRLLQ